MNPPFDVTARSEKLRTATARWRGRINACAPCVSAAIVALTVVVGLSFLCVENLSGWGAVRQTSADHANAIDALFFRH